MAQKFTPLNLSFLSNQYSPQANSIRNTAAAIMANAGWSQPTQATLKEIATAQAKAKKEYESQHKQSFLSSVFDLLQTPLYGVANALDESLAGHQSDSNDSVLEDTAKTVGGLFTGAVRGVGAGLRGASGILDVVPGVDISDDWQSNPEDKTHIGDVVLRDITGMSSKDAVDPANLAKVAAKLDELKKKGMTDRTSVENILMPFLPDPSDPKLQEKLYRTTQVAGIPFDIAFDPLNSVTIPTRAAKLATDVTEGVADARKGASEVEAIKNGLKTKNSSVFNPKAALDAPAPIAALPEEVTPGTLANVANVGVEGEKPFKTLANIGRRETAEPGIQMTPRDIKNLSGEIAKWSTMMSGPTWRQRAYQLLNGADGSNKWERTLTFLQRADEAVRKVKGRHDPAKMAPVLAARIREDLQAAVKKPGLREVERRLMNDKRAEDVVVRPNGPRLKVAEARLANSVVRKFEREIFGSARAPGTGEGLARAIAEGRNVRYSGPQQARMWNQITSSLKYGNSTKYDKAVRILRSVEDYFIGKGFIPHSAAKTAESVPLRLSQVAEALGPQTLEKNRAFITGILRGDPKALAHLEPAQIEALRALRESEATAVAPAVQKGMEAAKTAADVIAKAPFSVARKSEATNKLLKDIKTFTAAQGGGDVGAHVVGEYMGNILGKNDVINNALRANKLKTEAWLGKVGKDAKSAAVNDPEFVRSVTNAIGRAADLPSPRSLSGATGAASRVADWLGARFNAAYGVQDMRPIYLKQQASAMETTARRAKLINDLGRRFNPNDADLWHEAFRTAQQNGLADGRVAELQSEISKVMENLFGGTGLRSGAVADSTVVGRNRLLLEELNKNLKRFGLSQFKFTDGKSVKDATGVEHDFSKGLDWMRSWEAWNVTKPYEFLHKVQNAIEFTVREKNMFDEIISRFASPAKSGSVKYGVKHPRLAGYFFTQEGAKQAQTFVRMLEEVSTPNSKALQHFDHVLSKLKASLTIYIPGHHMTNLIGDMYYNWIAGVNKPVRYEQAIKTMLAQKGRYGDFATLEQLAGPKALEQAVARSMIKPDAGLVLPAQGNKVIVTMQNGTKVTADMIYTAAFREGILPGAKVLEDVESGATSILDKFRPLGGRGQRAVHNVAEVRDHIPRLAQFIDGIAKHKGSFSSAIESSARSVRKWHPDGLDVTKFERTVMKRVFPFYSWTRKAIPLAIEASVFAAPKVMAYPRLMEAIGLMNGVDPSQGISDPFPGDQMFPDWLRQRGIGPIFGGAGGYTVINPSTPVLDVLAQVGNPGDTAIQMLNPMAKVPLETAQGQTLGQKVPIQTNQQWLDYYTKQIPVASQLGRASGTIGVSDSTRAEGFPNWTNILNLLTGTKMTNTGKYQKSAQFDLREYFKQKARQQGN